jgi:LDH2 family malate/lactate/ureidoglycolate dehydrogenase
VSAETSATSSVVVCLDDLRTYCQGLLEAAGLPSGHAELVADSLVDADARGIGSHGVLRTRIYAERLRAGLLDPRATPTVVRDHPGGCLIDAGNAIGHVGALAGVDLAADRALERAAAVVGVRGSNHCGTLAYFVRRATARGVVVIAASNAPPTMVLHGGRTRAVGTNPLAVGIPHPSGPPVVIDMATSAVARGKIILAHQVGAGIPPDWAVDQAGVPTSDAARALAGSVLPFAGPKGSGLALMLDLLCGGLLSGVTGEGIGDMYDDWTRPQQVGHLFVAIDPAAFLGQDAFAALVAETTERVHGLPPAEGFDRVQLPGEVEDIARAAAERDGLVLADAVVRDLESLGDELGVPSALPVQAQPDSTADAR